MAKANRGKVADQTMPEGWLVALSAFFRDWERVGTALNDGWDINAPLRPKKGLTLLMAAVVAGDEKGVRWLLRRGADPAIKSRGRSALAMAAGHGSGKCLAVLMKTPADFVMARKAAKGPKNVAIVEQVWAEKEAKRLDKVLSKVALENKRMRF